MTLDMTLTSRIKDCEHELVVSGKFNFPELIRETLPLAKEIESRGIGVVLTPINWPRDFIYFHKDGTFTLVNPEKFDQVRDCPHAAWHGGAYLYGNNFLIGSQEAIPSSKRRATQKVLGAEGGIYIDIRSLFPSGLEGISVKGCPSFYKKDAWHIDLFFNLGNNQKVIVTYDEEKLRKLGRRLAHDTGYDLALLPKEEAAFAAAGFIELGNTLVVDCRAERSMKILERLGYSIIPTPLPLEEVNRDGGSLRCITREMPIVKHKMRFHDFVGGHGEDGPAEYSIFSDLEEHFMVMSNSPRRRLREMLFPKEFYP